MATGNLPRDSFGYQTNFNQDVASCVFTLSNLKDIPSRLFFQVIPKQYLANGSMAPRTHSHYQFLGFFVILFASTWTATSLILPSTNRPTQIIHLVSSGLETMKPSDRINDLVDSEWILREPALTQEIDEKMEADSMKIAQSNSEESLEDTYDCSAQVFLAKEQPFHATPRRPLRRRRLEKRACKDQSIWKRIHLQLKKIKRSIVMWIIEALAKSRVTGMRTYLRIIKVKRIFGGKCKNLGMKRRKKEMNHSPRITHRLVEFLKKFNDNNFHSLYLIF
ncbi:hypothetical protein DFH28DRAFT_429672 [Melampsora americana]|nr:hypothetical protein DFH28DRAFT_429672 [Melampsora americana]